jgi:hypothetical protein
MVETGKGAPERIWADDFDGRWYNSDRSEVPTCVLYVRADKVRELEAELRERPDWTTVNATYEKWKARAEAAEARLAPEGVAVKAILAAEKDVGDELQTLYATAALGAIGGGKSASARGERRAWSKAVPIINRIRD